MSGKSLQYIIKFKESLRLLVILLKYFMIADAIDFQIDQKMARNSFKYFGSQPHWDNDRVQWWYGNAAKSLH